MDATVEVKGVKFDSGNAVLKVEQTAKKKDMLETVDWQELPLMLQGQTKLAEKR